MRESESVVEVRFQVVVIDRADPRSLAAFWEDLTGYGAAATTKIGSRSTLPITRCGSGFQQVPEGKVAKNRVHIDFAATDEEATAKEIEGMGATRLWVSEDPEDPFVVLADPEGNEFCIVRADPE
jgi:predicted enzyme related to lactoylglutathione lyase